VKIQKSRCSEDRGDMFLRNDVFEPEPRGAKAQKTSINNNNIIIAYRVATAAVTLIAFKHVTCLLSRIFQIIFLNVFVDLKLPFPKEWF
jgi:hypothetical protein